MPNTLASVKGAHFDYGEALTYPGDITDRSLYAPDTFAHSPYAVLILRLAV